MNSEEFLSDPSQNSNQINQISSNNNLKNEKNKNFKESENKIIMDSFFILGKSKNEINNQKGFKNLLIREEDYVHNQIDNLLNKKDFLGLQQSPTTLNLN